MIVTQKKQEEDQHIDEGDPLQNVDMETFTPVYVHNAILMYFIDLEADQKIHYEEIISPSLGPFLLMNKAAFRRYEEFRGECLKTDAAIYSIANAVLDYFLRNHTNLNMENLKVSKQVALLPLEVAQEFEDWQAALR